MNQHAYKKPIIDIERGTWLLAGLCIIVLPVLILLSEVL
jgi:hypothetical protein